ncbi:MAG TPA: MMPL family transporter [Jiangellaceae bacterium]|nr:MMPL family transporter [Jiangellaceae bacterium]
MPPARHRAEHGPGRAILRAGVLIAVVLAWMGVAGLGGPAIGSLSQVQENDNAAFLPTDAESTQVSDLQEEFTGDEELPAFVVAESSTGEPLTEQDLAALGELAESLPDEPVTGDRTLEQFLTNGQIPLIPAEDEQAVLLTLSLDAAAVDTYINDESATQLVVDGIREAAGQTQDQLSGSDADAPTIEVTGPAGLSADLSEAFGAIDGLLLTVALSVVLVILLIVYRSFILPFAVLLTSVSALAAAGLAVYHLADAGALTLSGQSQGILFILVVGAATDYGLLLTARYREELLVHSSRFTAMRRAWRASVEPILASGGTVILGVLCLLLSELNSNRSLGPVAALGIAAALIAALTLLPALLLAGRWVFYPRIPHPAGRHAASADPASPEEGRGGLWNRIAGLVRHRPRRVWVSTAAALAVAAAFVPTLSAGGTSQTDVFLTEVEAVSGQEALARHFPGGAGTPASILAPEDSLDTVTQLAESSDGISTVSAVPEGGAEGGPAGGAPPEADAEPRVVDGIVEVQATLVDEADSEAAIDTVRDLREDLSTEVPEAMVGGETATQLDTREAATRDRTLIIPVVLVVVLAVLIALLRSLLAPVLLMAANVLSFGSALGISAVVFNHVFDFPGADPVVPLFGFVFLVALGIDYTIFLMTRVREEAKTANTRDSVLIGLRMTGGVITSAGVVLAATFGALGVVPLLFLAQLAFIVSLGVLIDTLIVRSLLVPALVYQIGDRVWWPSRLSRRRSPTPGQ